MSKDGSGTVLEAKMFRINQLEQENGFLMQVNMAYQNTLQLCEEENQDLRGQLMEQEN